MSNFVRSLRSSVRSHTPDGEVEKLGLHIAVSAILGIVGGVIALLYNHSENILDNIGVLVGFTGTIFALLFTILAIILAFQGQYSENRAINELQRTGHYRMIFQRFYLSVFSVGILLMTYASIGVFGIYQIDLQYQIPHLGIEINPIETVTVIIITWGFLLTVLRMTSCFIIYYRIEYIMRQNSSE